MKYKMKNQVLFFSHICLWLGAMCNGKNHVDTLKVSTPMHKALIFFNSSKTNTTLHVTTNYPLKLGQYIVSKRENWYRFLFIVYKHISFTQK